MAPKPSILFCIPGWDDMIRQNPLFFVNGRKPQGRGWLIWQGGDWLFAGPDERLDVSDGAFLHNFGKRGLDDQADAA
jgi:hypothetical protein